MLYLLLIALAGSFLCLSRERKQQRRVHSLCEACVKGVVGVFEPGA